MEVYNATSSMLAEVPTTSGWLVTTIVFIAILLTVFFLSKNFRQFCYGAVVTTILSLVGLLSRYIGKATGTHDYVPITWFCYIIGFIGLSIVIGTLLQHTKFIKEFEGNYIDEKATKKRKA